MNIGIVTIYEAITNLGSYLQAYAMQTVLREMGHDVCFVEKVPTRKVITKCVFRLNPKREFFLRIQKCEKYLKAKRLLKTVSWKEIGTEQFDCLIYGSDEIWNMDNPYFKDKLFWGTDDLSVPRIAYAVSVGAMKETTLQNSHDVSRGICDFQEIFPRDDRTQDMIGRYVDRELSIVCDPTLLVPVSMLQKPIKLPREKYLLVYTYGVDKPTEDLIVRFAREKGLQIVSPCFWHIWCDHVIECEPLQFGTLIKHAEYVFTSTFHGAIFTMLNHKKCAILPVRSKVQDVVVRLGAEQHLISPETTHEEFVGVIELDFPKDVFEKKLEDIRARSKTMLEGALKCLEK